MENYNEIQNLSLSRNNTSVMKGIAICGMLLLHLYTTSFTESVDSPNRLLFLLGSLGQVCVSIFLFCSGYGLSVQYRSLPKSLASSTKFILKRLVKFYANYWTVFIIFVPISILLFNRSLESAYGNHSTFLSLFVDILGIAGYRSFNVTWWFNRWILFLYLLFPAIYWTTHKIGAFLSAIIGFAILLIPFVYEIHLLQYSFVLGVLWEMEENSPSILRFIKRNPHVSFILCIVTTVLFYYIKLFPPFQFISKIYMDPFIACSICALVLATSRLIKRPTGVLSFLGSHSSNIYMVHTFFYLYWFSDWFRNSPTMMNGLGFIVLMVISLLTSILLELLKKKIGIYDFFKKIIERIS